jgi:hypothetical protein
MDGWMDGLIGWLLDAPFCIGGLGHIDLMAFIGLLVRIRDGWR